MTPPGEVPVLNRQVLQFACFALCLLAPALATAGARPWISGSLGGSMYAMGDVNDYISTINSGLAGSGREMDEITQGLNYGLAFGLDVGSGFSVGLGYDRLNAQTAAGDANGSIEYDFPARVLRGFGRYSFASTGKTQGFLEASLGRITSDGTVSILVSAVGPTNGDLDGSGIALEGAGGLSYWTFPRIGLFGTLGFRSANVDNVEVDGSPIYNTSGDRYAIDYSGVFARLGLTVALAP
jgi:hypothetical protein